MSTIPRFIILILLDYSFAFRIVNKIGTEIYRAVSHVDGWTGLPQYEIR